MAKLSDKIDLSKAMQEAKAEFIADSSNFMAEPAENPVKALLNSGVKAHKERQNKKQEIKKATEDKSTEENSLFAELLPKEEKKTEEKWPKSYEETCEYELRRAHEEGWENPDFDFRKIYTKGQHMWFVRILSSLGEKEVVEVIMQTVYPRTIVASQPKALCHCIGYNMRDQLFYTQKEAAQFYDSVQVSSRYKTAHPMRRKDDDYDEDDTPSSQESLEELMNGEEDDE